MKQYLKNTALGLSVALLLSSQTSASQAFSDVSSSQWFYDYVETARKSGFVTGYEDNSFKPDNSISYTEFAVMMCSAFFPEELEYELNYGSRPVWYAPYINTLLKAKTDSGLSPIQGTDAYQTYRLSGNLNAFEVEMSREDVAITVATIAEIVGNVEPATILELVEIGDKILDINTFTDKSAVVMQSYHYGYMGGDENGSFNPHKSISRAEVSVVMSKMLTSGHFDEEVEDESDIPEVDTDSSENDSDSSENDTDSSENNTDSSENNTDSSENDTDSSENDTNSSENDTDSSENDTDSSDTDSSENDTDSSENDTDSSDTDTDTDTDSSENDTESSENNTDSSENDTDSSENDTDSSENDTDSSETDTDSSENDTESSENNTDSSENDTESSENNTDSSENDTDSSENNTDSSESDTDSSETDTEEEVEEPDGYENTTVFQRYALEEASSSTAYTRGVTTARWSSVNEHSIFSVGENFITSVVNNGTVVLTTYDGTTHNEVSKKEIPCPLPLFGGFFQGDNGYYGVYGQNNSEENDSKEVYRVVKYDTNFNVVGQTSVTGGECTTTVPFDAGTVAFAENGTEIVVHTSRERYTSNDGLNHQSQFTMVINTSTMSVTNKMSEFQSNHVSHSFNQGALYNGSNHVLVDHGDAYPRAIVVHEMQSNGSYKEANLLEIPGAVGANSTGVTLGGVVGSSSSYLVGINQIDFSKATSFNSFSIEGLTVDERDPIVLVHSHSGSTKAVTLSNCVDQGKTASAPMLVDLGNDTFMALWEEFDSASPFASRGVYYTILDGAGNKTAVSHLPEGKLSSKLDPVLHGDWVIWFTDSNNERTLYKVKAN